MKRKMIFAAYAMLSAFYFDSSNYAECQTQFLDSFFAEHRSLGNIDSEGINPGRVTDGKICNQIGFQYYENGDYANAIGYYKKAIALSPDYPIPFNNLGVVYYKSNKLELARECFSKAIDLNPEYVKAICNLAIVSYKVGDMEAAKQLFHKAKHIDSSYVKQRIDNYINHNQ
ncbi:MAG: tetratricopeptide repeat protein [Deltaproteobacteria bacterium]|nr:tetratricopeptide repeat protein [Deltaproteobacteria bacterium]